MTLDENRIIIDETFETDESAEANEGGVNLHSENVIESRRLDESSYKTILKKSLKHQR